MISNSQKLPAIPEGSEAATDSRQQLSEPTAVTTELSNISTSLQEEVQQNQHQEISPSHTRSGQLYNSSKSFFNNYNLKKLISDNKKFDIDLLNILNICDETFAKLEFRKENFKKINKLFKSDLEEYKTFEPDKFSSPKGCTLNKPLESVLLDCENVENIVKDAYQECLDNIFESLILEENSIKENYLIEDRSLIISTFPNSFIFDDSKSYTLLREKLLEEQENCLITSIPRNRLSLSEEFNKKTTNILNTCIDLKFPRKIKMETEKLARLVASLVPEFHGNNINPGELQSFLGCCKQVAACVEADQIPSLLNLFMTKLRGNAYLTMQNKTLLTISQFEKSLKEHFAPRKTYIQISNELRQCFQYPSETLSSFILRINQLLAACKEAALDQYPNDATSLEKELELAAIYSLKAGINNPIIKQCILMCSETTLSDICDKALKLDLENKNSYPMFNQNNTGGLFQITIQVTIITKYLTFTFIQIF